MEVEYRVGAATTDITPPVGTPLGGYAFRGVHQCTGVCHPLTAAALVIDDGTTPVLLISAEWLGFYDKADLVRARVMAATGLSEGQIVLTGTHTHCGPAIRDFDVERHGRIDTDYVTSAADRIAAAAAAAWRDRLPARLRRTAGHLDLAVCRRRPDPSRPGRVLSGPHPYPDGPTDHELGVLLAVSSVDGAVRTVIVNYACHPTAMAGAEIGGDYVGFALDHLTTTFPGAVPIFLQGCAGDQSPRPLHEGSDRFDRRTPAQVRALGEELGVTVRDAVNAGLTEVTGPISLARSVIDLEIEPEPTGDRQLPVPFEIQTVQFGSSLLLVAMAAEMTVEHGLRLKDELADRFGQIIPVGYANAMVGYVPVRRQFTELGYEVLDANRYHGRGGRYLETTEDQIHAEIRRLLASRPTANQLTGSDERSDVP